jgi:mono/diheme cytochrome c family protein
MPTDDDLFQVISRGMSGSAMFPFGHLGEEDRRALVGHVRTLITSGFEERYLRQARERGIEDDAAELSEALQRKLKPGPILEVSTGLDRASPESVTRGGVAYQKLCSACHGNTGKGDGAEIQANDDGSPTRPRDFTRGIFKGGREFHQLYARIMLGMPGSPMPGSHLTVQPSAAADIVHFVLSVSPPADRVRVDHQRRQLLAQRLPHPLPEASAEIEWKSAAVVPITVSPLWWREYPEPDLQVQALHDGKELAIRLSWQDNSQNALAGKPEEFEDMAAVQLFNGKMEPFLGMGSATAGVDLWLWRASWQHPVTDADSLLDDYPFDTPFYRERAKRLDKPIPDMLTARAAGNANVPSDGKSAGSSLAAGGFGSTTFRPKPSQVVGGHGIWKDGRWTVVLRRPLLVGADAGIALTPGAVCSLAVALWDGAARDRNGQKLVSIWHDLKLE